MVCDALTFDDLHLNDHLCPHLADMATHGAIGLMNCAVAGPRSLETAIMTLATGQMLSADPLDVVAENDWELVPNDNDAARIVYIRRAGLLDPEVRADRLDPERSVKHLGVVSLIRRGINPYRLGTLLRQGQPRIKTCIIGNADTDHLNRSAALLTVDAAGVGAGLVALVRPDANSPFGRADNPLTLAQCAMESDAGFLVIQMGDGARAEAARDRLSAEQYHSAHDEAARRLDLLIYLLRAQMADGKVANIIVVSPRPAGADEETPGSGNRLTPILALGPDFPTGSLTSATTRTPGLVANVDLAPTILKLFNKSIPNAMTGRPIRTLTPKLQNTQIPEHPSAGTVAPTPEHLASIARLDYVATMNDAALIRVILPIGTICVLGIAAGLIALKTRGEKAARWFAPITIFALNLPAAALLAPLLIPPTLWEYGLRIAGWMAALTVVCYLGSRIPGLSPPVCAVRTAAAIDAR